MVINNPGSIYDIPSGVIIHLFSFMYYQSGINLHFMIVFFNCNPLLCDSREGGRGDEYMKNTAEKGAREVRTLFMSDRFTGIYYQ